MEPPATQAEPLRKDLHFDRSKRTRGDTSWLLSPQELGREGPQTPSFLQHRVARSGLLGGTLALVFWVLRLSLELLTGSLSNKAETIPMLVHALGGCAMLLVWWLCRKTPRSVAFLYIVEFCGLLTATGLFCVMGYFLPLWVRPEHIVLEVLLVILLGRTIFVPSSGRLTVLLGLVMGLQLLLLTWLLYRDASLTSLGFPQGFPPQARSGIWISTMMWWSLVVFLSVVISSTVYGLRRRVHQAERLGQYTLEEKLGQGGMGVVYRARHAMLRRPTAIKLLSAARIEEIDLQRFAQEVQLTASLTHPNTITVFDYGRTPDGRFYYAMEYLDGANLSEVVAFDGAQPPGRVVHVLRQAAEALREAHEAGLIHRDIKPANIMLCRRGGLEDVVKVLDFGLVKHVKSPSQEDKTLQEQAEELVGTPGYMPPEAIVDPSTMDARSDIYALGVVGYYLLTGQELFQGKSILEICGQHIYGEPIPPSQRLKKPLPDSLETLLLDCLAKKPEERPHDINVFLERLHDCTGFAHWQAEDKEAWWQRFRQEQPAPPAPDATIEQTIRIEATERFSPRAE